MKMPGFSAEASPGKVKDGYTLTLGYARESGKVLPQFFLPWKHVLSVLGRGRH
jgi:hypothetical protein